jgi:serine/threonine-protein kinase RsbW
MEPLSRCEFDSDKLILKFEATFSANLDMVSSVIDRMMGIVQTMGCAEGKEFEIETSLREALVNAVVHGCGNDPNKKVQCCVACDESKGLLIVVRDPGPGFQPDSLPSPILAENIFSSHGRGIFMINQLMDEVNFKRGGTEIHMKKK